MELQIIASDDIAKLINRLNQYAHRGQDTYPAMEAIGDDMLRVEEIVFSSNGRRGGGSWKQLKESTKAKKGTSEILRTREANPGYSVPGNDALFNSLTVKGAPDQILMITRREIQFGTNVPAAGITQKTRPFLKFTQQDIERWKSMLANWLVDVP